MVRTVSDSLHSAFLLLACKRRGRHHIDLPNRHVRRAHAAQHRAGTHGCPPVPEPSTADRNTSRHRCTPRRSSRIRAGGGISDEGTRTSFRCDMRSEPLSSRVLPVAISAHPLILSPAPLRTWCLPTADASVSRCVPAGGPWDKCHLSPPLRQFL